MTRANPLTATAVFVLFLAAGALLCGTAIVEARGLAAPEYPRVSVDKESATIEGELDVASELALRIGGEKDKLVWADRFAGGGAFKTVVESSGRIKLQDGSYGSGLVFTTKLGGTKAVTNIHLPKTGPLPSGQLSFREESNVVRKDGATTFADIRTEDGKSLPVSIFVRKAGK